jgi:hypothetical protein
MTQQGSIFKRYNVAVQPKIVQQQTQQQPATTTPARNTNNKPKQFTKEEMKSVDNAARNKEALKKWASEFAAIERSDTNKYLGKFTAPVTTKKMFELVESVIQEVVEKMSDDELIMIMMGGQSFVLADVKQTEKLKWIEAQKKNYPQSKSTKNTDNAVPIIERFNKLLYEKLAILEDYKALPKKDVPWSAIFASSPFVEAGTLLEDAALETGSQYKKFKNSAWWASQGNFAKWMAMAQLSWDCFFVLMMTALSDGAEIEDVIDKRNEVYYKFHKLQTIDHQADATSIWDLVDESARTKANLIAHVGCIDWLKIFRHEIFKNPDKRQTIGQQEINKVYAAIGTTMADLKYILENNSSEFAITPLIQDPGAERDNYYLCLKKAKRMRKAVVDAYSGKSGNGRTRVTGTAMKVVSTYAANLRI